MLMPQTITFLTLMLVYTWYVKSTPLVKEDASITYVGFTPTLPQRRLFVFGLKEHHANFIVVVNFNTFQWLTTDDVRLFYN